MKSSQFACLAYNNDTGVLTISWVSLTLEYVNEETYNSPKYYRYFQISYPAMISH